MEIIKEDLTKVSEINEIYNRLAQQNTVQEVYVTGPITIEKAHKIEDKMNELHAEYLRGECTLEDFIKDPYKED